MPVVHSLDRADAYINSEWGASRSPWSVQPKKAFVTISRESGSGGASLAPALAQRLNLESQDGPLWNCFESTLIKTMLKRNHLSSYLARFLPEDKVPEITSTLGELVGLHPSLWELIRKTNETMCALARSGRAVLVGRGANFATARETGGVHVRLIAPVDHRARYIAQLYKCSEETARIHNARCDAARRRYVKTHFDANVADVTSYDLVINTAQISLREAVELIASRVHAVTATV